MPRKNGGTAVPSPQLLTSSQAAEMLNLKTETLRKWRQAGTGPKWIRVNGKVLRYRLTDLLAFVSKREVA